MKKKQMVRNSIYIGIDPGQSGGVAVLTRTGSVLIPMPKTEHDVYNSIRPFGGLFPHGVRATIERVHAMPKQGVSSTFKFGRGYGFLRGCLVALGIPFEDVTPQTWMRALNVPPRRKNETKAQFKQRLRGVAQQLFPSEKITLATADALLIAEYCRRTSNGN